MQVKQTYTRTVRLSGEDLDQLLSETGFIMKREGWSFDVYLKNTMKEYNLRHGPGNNSFQLDKFGVTWTKAVSMNKCGFARHPKGVSDLAVGVAMYKPQSQVLGVCGFHVAAVEEDIRCGGKLWADLKVSREQQKETR
jgi:hypothetical protein